MNRLLSILPVALIFTAAFCAARPTKQRVVLGSWLLAALAAVTGVAIPASSFVMWAMGAGMSAGTQTGLSPLGLLWMLSPIPYYLWVAVTIAPLKRPSALRAWHMKMHFGYALVYLLVVRAYYIRGGFIPITEVSWLSAVVVLWYRFVEGQEKEEANQTPERQRPCSHLHR